ACADIAIAAESAVFAFSEARLGLVPATISPHVIEKIGVGRALPLFLTGERFGAAHAERIGLVRSVVTESELDSAVAATVDALLAASPAAQSAAKIMARRVNDAARTEVDSYTSQMITAIRASDEGREGVTAFLEKRKPRWAE
ncbi:MAG: enoyl-CoA hydratase-related protein, partial [Chloroflexota bacterium]